MEHSLREKNKMKAKSGDWLELATAGVSARNLLRSKLADMDTKILSPKVIDDPRRKMIYMTINISDYNEIRNVMAEAANILRMALKGR